MCAPPTTPSPSVPLHRPQSYLSIDRLIAAARESGADAVHPGYGFLAERAAFAEAVRERRARLRRAAGRRHPGHGRQDRGPAPDAGGRRADRARRQRARSTISRRRCALAAARSAIPVMVKAAAGGGGKGMRVVRDAGELAAALEAAASEALKAFGDASVYLEKFIERPRHVEIQVLADARAHRASGRARVLDPAAAPEAGRGGALGRGVDPELRERMGAAAVAAAQAVGYRGAGTCEFLLAPDGSFYFLEMNTRIQVEHPVTELVYGVDLVREQLRIAAGEPMRVPRGRLSPRGWAIECRITSEDSGQRVPARPPAAIEYLRRAGRARGSLGQRGRDRRRGHALLRLAAGQADRVGAGPAQAIARMTRALDELVMVGVATNQGFHRRLHGGSRVPAGRDRHPVSRAAARPAGAGPYARSGSAHLAVAAALAEDERPTGAAVRRVADGWQPGR